MKPQRRRNGHAACAPPREATPSVLVIGYGNPGRGDDGVGPVLAARLETLQVPGVVVESDYQLSIEHAAMAAEHDVVVFVDAAVDADEPFYLRELAAAPGRTCSSHALSPAQVLAIAGSCFGRVPRAYLLGIRPTALDAFEERLTPDAEAAVDAALAHLLDRVEELRTPATRVRGVRL